MGKVLIIDDEEERILAPLLRQLGRVFGGENVKGVARVSKALQIVEREAIDVVVTDVMMPEMDGYDFCRAFRSNPLNLGYIIILSGRDGGIAAGLRAGADVYFRKPYDIDDLVAQIEKGMEVTRNRFHAVQDALTGLYLRRIFDAVFTLEAAKLDRVSAPLSVILFDIDHFKRVNDTFGHQVGDLVLRDAAELLKKFSRRSDLFVRYGGEEFLLLLPGAQEEKAMEIAQRLHHAMLDHIFPEAGRVTASFGVATTTWNPQHLVARADHALYAAKSAGRNQVMLAETEPPSSEHRR
ncbi:MAG: diguanylate cyclase [Magnetococcales bacterium]|nr:diguanylate cyclase [Magnetococcales bacterium]